MASISAEEAGGQNIIAALDVVRYSELGQKIIDGSDEGYNVMVYSVPEQIITFSSYADHPHIMIDAPGAAPESTAAGAYQILLRMWQAYKPILKLPDFGKRSQDLYALRQFSEEGAMAAFKEGNFELGISRISNIWASLPGANYPGQRMRRMGELRVRYLAYGGTIAK